ncbi:MAG: LacI family transcriptional regulator [Phycisphaerae bacterium]|nr:LacI family transcriptional regulator [Phycisphaerae bacterium]
MQRSSTSRRLVLAVAQGIAEGRWLCGGELPSVRSLAKEFGVSAPTAMKVIQLAAAQGLVALRPSRPALVLPDAARAARRILGTAALPDSPRESSGAQTRVALLVPAMEPPGYAPFASMRQHIDMEAAAKGLAFDLIHWPLKEQIPFALSLPARGYAGAVCLAMRPSYLPGLTALRNQGFPTLIINRRYRHLGLPAIAGDDYKPVRELVLRLVRMGHRNMSLVTDLLPSSNMETHDAIRGWVDGLNETGTLGTSPMPTCIVPNLEPLRRSGHVFEQLLLRPDRPTALLFYWPTWTEVLLQDPRFSRLRVPDDISLALAIPGERPPRLPDGPPLTTLDIDYQRQADCIVNRMADMIGGRSCEELLLLPLKLHLTDSLGPPPRSAP